MADDEVEKEPSGENEVFLDGAGATDGGVPLDSVFHALSHRRRRYVLYCLQEHDPATLDDVARQVAAWESGVPRDEVTAGVHDEVQSNLYHAHLPALMDAMLVEYDERSGAIRYRDPPAVLDAILQVISRIEKPE